MRPQIPVLTPVTRHYLMDFALRAGIFLLIGIIYLAAPEQLDFTAPTGLTLPLILLWAAVFCSMAAQLNPKSRLMSVYANDQWLAIAGVYGGTVDEEDEEGDGE